MYRESFRLSKNTLKWVKKLHKRLSSKGKPDTHAWLVQNDDRLFRYAENRPLWVGFSLF